MIRACFENTASISTETTGDPGGSGSMTLVTMKCFSLFRGSTAVHFVWSSFFGLNAAESVGTIMSLSTGEPARLPPPRRNPDQASLLVDLARQLDGLAANLAILDVPERPRRKVYGGLECFAAVGALHADRLRELARPRPRLEHRLEVLQPIDCFRVQRTAGRCGGMTLGLHGRSMPTIAATRPLLRRLDAGVPPSYP